LEENAGFEGGSVHRTNIPVSAGSNASVTLDLPLCTVLTASFPAGARLEMHTHARALFGIMLRGSFVTHIASRRFDCSPNTSWVEPREEKHANYVGNKDATALVVLPDPQRLQELEVFNAFFDRLYYQPDPSAATIARKIAHEIRRPDALTPLAVESAVVAMLVPAARVSLLRERAPTPPPWLITARELVHAEFRRGITLSTIAAAVRVHPTHLAHTFKRYYGTTVADYARRLRLAWAIDRILHSADSMSAIAYAAGYADQSHLTRECKATIGETPARLRQNGTRGQPSAL
jgi:AraC family transcriptional regulator